MKTIFHKRVTIITITMLSLATLVAHSAQAWGPERQTYTNNQPADHVTFNSITDNAAVGDERNFVRVGEANSTTPYTDTIKVEPGKEYEVYIYYHNNAAGNLNASGKGIANGVTVSSAYPVRLSKGENGMVSGIISTTDGNPAKVWDEAYFTTDVNEVVLRYKPGTAIIHNDGKVNGSVLSDNLFTESGTYIGINELDGRIPGCAEYSGYITYTLVAENTDTDFNKQVSLDGENWSENVSAKPGQIVTYKVTFKNTGNTDLTNVIFKDVHSENLSLRSGTTKVFGVNNTEGKTIDDIIDLSGYNVGNVAPGALVQIIYQSMVKEDTSLCGSVLNNKIVLNYNSADQGEDNAMVTVSCEPTPEDCTNNPNLPGCQDCTTNPDLPGCQEKNCKTNPEMEGCQELPNTGPLEIVLAIVIIAGLGGGGYYLYRTHKTLKKVESGVSGKDNATGKSKTKTTSPESKSTKTDSTQTPTQPTATK